MGVSRSLGWLDRWRSGSFFGFGEPMLCAIGEGDEGKHDGDFDQDADDGGEGSGGGEAEEADGDSDGEFEEIGGADHSGGCGDIVGEFEEASEGVGDGEDAVALEEEGEGDQADKKGFGDDDIGLETEEEDDSEEESKDRGGFELFIEV